MNKAITDGLVLMPLPFVAGLGVWSSEDGTPGTDTYATSTTAAFVSADQDFGGCLELQKTATTTRVRYMGETPILPGCYLRITARIKAVAGAFPTVRIAAYAGAAGGGAAGGVTTTGPATQLTAYGDIVEVSAIVGTGARTGVDMVWLDPAFGHFGIDLTGPSGGVVRLDDLIIEDITSAFQRDIMSVVDVRDYGAIGDGNADDSEAFETADAAANGRRVLVPAGTFRLAQDVTIQNRIIFEGTVTQPANKRFILQKEFDYQAYVDAFGDEEIALRKAYQALINFSDHDSLNLNGRRINLTEPLDMQAADPLKTVFATRRVIRNGQIRAVDGPAWNTTQVTSQGTYSASQSTRLSNVSNIANIPVGALVEGAGVGREVYVTAVNVGQQRLTLSQPLFDAVGTQSFTFKRFKYLLDFSGYDSLSQFVLDDIEFQCEGVASGIMIAPDGLTFHLRDCFMTKPKDRGLTSIGRGCQGMMLDRCQFISNEQALPVPARTSIAFNANANDVKVRDNRVALFKHFCVLSGTGNLINGNHWFHGDSDTNAVRKGGIILTSPNCMTAITGNYIDNNFIELSNEHDATPALGNQLSFGGLTMTGNVFTALGAANWFNFIVVKPHGPDHFVHGLTVTGNVFRAINGNIRRIDMVDTTFADLDYTRMRAISFANNTFNGIDEPIYNPAQLVHTQSSTARSWTADTETNMPFGGQARFVDSFMAEGAIRDSGNDEVFDMPYFDGNQGSDKQGVKFTFSKAVKGKIRYAVRMDNPL
ncbi:glycosyl hydrolase family 28-related protein [Yoonia sp. 208BN28-4]|uniref:glycosyl hydrolase family 28-related protein n=1 Tax=Yoonia sp. 208BN28-4 TaxID=3126505 RepID=UPI0030A462C5